MNVRKNEDRLVSDSPTGAAYNHIYNVDDISNESGEAEEPVTLQEMKDYLRLEGFATDSTNVTSEAPLALTLLEGETTVQDDMLKDATILTLAREGTVYTKSSAVGNRKFTHDPVTGIIAFQNAGEVGDEGIDITYGYAGTAGGDDAFDFDNDLIEDLINEGRIWVENFTGVHLIAKTLQVVGLNQAGMLELPGPVTDAIVIKQNSETVDSEDYEFIGSAFPKMVTTFDDRIVLEYDAGYTRATCPKGLKGAIKAYVADNYENRGDDDQTNTVIFERAARKARPYRRLTLFG